ncbi:unnamed protein product [Bursaphelenchus okinawaensis]|uniref:Uncharacterized protein n=1 Tax=Bursaphelenchus okinawaensis TaxID=465554 RepID=A0A811KT36_9BILA|nr:unnamed protein product [Bursaphelenchus okinawaensis]CAG9112828.1 unnamed protein product [Bursaphelenchus okinawaensis]
MIRAYNPRDNNRRNNYRNDVNRRGGSPIRRRSPPRRGRSPPPPVRRDFDRRNFDHRRRDVPVVRRPAKIDPRKYLPPVRNPAKYVDPPARRTQPIRIERKRPRSPIKNGNAPKRIRTTEKPKVDEEIIKLERKLRFDLTDIFTLCIHSDKATHTERLDLVGRKLEELRNEIDAMPKDKPENLELEEVDCEETGSGDEEETDKRHDEEKEDDDYDEADNIILDQVDQPEEEDSNDNNVPKSPPEEDKGESMNDEPTD